MKRPRIELKFVLIVFAIISFVVLFKSLNNLWLQSSTLRYKMLNEYLDDGGKADDTKTVLFWTKFFDDPKWGMKSEVYSMDYLKAAKCPKTNCVFTTNKELLQSTLDYDAIVFHAAETWFRMELPRTRSPDQVYVMASMESPGEIKHDLNVDYSFYNLTMSYRLDSDIKWPYGSATDLLTGREIAPALDVQWREPDEDFFDNKILEIVKHKQKTAAWFVSHCNVFSQRDDLVRKLQEFVDVDVYGKCGNFSCSRESTECDEMLNTTYRFYFAFENTLCIDYLTEKLYNTINSYVIPVIFSGAEISRFLPPKSYINVESFATAEELANHLKFLTENPHEYVKYFWWRKHYKIATKVEMEFCALCLKLNEPNFHTKRQTYENIKDWFYRDTCRNPRIKF